MTRNWIFYGSPAAFLAGLLMVHCSSSSTTTITNSSSTTNESSSNSSTASSTKSSSTSSTTVASTSASSASGSKDAGSDGNVFNSHLGDTDADCKPTEGGLFCTPGHIGCGSDASCDLSTDICCENSMATPAYVCQAASAACGGTQIECNEAADCPSGQICCIHSTGTTQATAHVSCQAAPTCPDPTGSIASAQICRSNTECASGSCDMWNCLGNVIQACADPVPVQPSLCTKM